MLARFDEALAGAADGRSRDRRRRARPSRRTRSRPTISSRPPRPRATSRASTAYATAARAEGARDLLRLYGETRDQGFGAEVKRRILLGTFALSSGYYDAYYLKAQQVRTLIRRDFEQAFRGCDAIATPTTPAPAFRFGEKTDDPLQMYLADIFTVPANLAGLPALSLPCGLAAGLPVGLQLVGRRFEEETLLAPGRRLQGATSHHTLAPPL